MAPEPPHLVGTSRCLRCYSKDVEFRYFNNKKTNQPRYWCYSCNKFYTHGGKVRDSEPAGRNQAVPPMEPAEPAEVEGGEHDVGQEITEEMETRNKEEVVHVGEGSGQQRGESVDPDESEEVHKMNLPTKRTKDTTLSVWVKKAKVQHG